MRAKQKLFNVERWDALPFPNSEYGHSHYLLFGNVLEPLASAIRCEKVTYIGMIGTYVCR
jgi:hypothetical protein